MSLIIKGMEMPKNCLECMFRISYWKRALTPSGKIFTYGCMLNGKEINTLEKRCKDCPIVEIPTPHGRLIDCERATFPTAFRYNTNDYAKGWNDCIKAVQTAPTIIEAEVSE